MGRILPCPPFMDNVVDLRIFVLFVLLIPMKAGTLKILRKLDSRLRGNDVRVAGMTWGWNQVLNHQFFVFVDFCCFA